jgi:hypothetical protein
LWYIMHMVTCGINRLEVRSWYDSQWCIQGNQERGLTSTTTSTVILLWYTRN